MNVRTVAIAALLGLALFASPLWGAESARVVTRENAIRSECRFFAPVKVKVRYNDRLTILGQKGDWFLVSFRGVKGCIHKSALEQKSFRLSSLIGTGGGATSEEVSLAGKGFNPQVESAYKGKHPNLDFRTVDIIEGFKVPPAELEKFLKEGGLTTP